MEFGQQLLTVLVTSSVVGGLFAFVFKQYVSKYIAHEFDKRSAMLESHIKQMDTVDTTLLEGRLGVYQELVELTYRIRNGLRDGLAKRNAHEWDGTLRPLAAQLTETLYKYRFFLTDDLFACLHEFKRITQDALLVLDTQHATERIFDTDQYRAQIDRINNLMPRIAELHDDIRRIVSERLSAIQNPP